MTDRIKEKLGQLPEAPGIYKMLDAKGRIIYIGKSKCLKKRVKSYFVESPRWEKVKKMAPFIYDIDYMVTDTHLEAMLLECELIKQIKPYFNVLMKRDEHYVFLKVESNENKAPLRLVSQREEDSFGPFRSRSRLRDALESLKNIYPIRKEGRKYMIEYHIFPIVMDSGMYAENRKNLLGLCRNPKAMRSFIKEVEKKMKAAAADCRFETAMMYRDVLNGLSYAERGLNTYREWMGKMVFADLIIPQGHKLFFIVNGQVVQKVHISEMTEEAKTEFIRSGREKSQLFCAAQTDKGSIDYRDIIYTELTNLPPECLEIVL